MLNLEDNYMHTRKCLEQSTMRKIDCHGDMSLVASCFGGGRIPTRGHVRAVPFARKLVDSCTVPTHLFFLISPYYNPSRPFGL